MLSAAKQAGPVEIAEVRGVLWCPCEPLQIYARALLDKEGSAWVPLKPFKHALALRWQIKTFQRLLGEQRVSKLQALQSRLVASGALDCLAKKESEAYWLRLDALRPLIQWAVPASAPLHGRLLYWLKGTLERRVSEVWQLCQGNDGDDSDAGTDTDSDSDSDFCEELPQLEGPPQAAATAERDRPNVQALEEEWRRAQAELRKAELELTQAAQRLADARALEL
eukprot:10782582-Alexandrium_andersonii.AAC.1